MRKFALFWCILGVLSNAFECNAAARYKVVGRPLYGSSHALSSYETQHYTRVLDYLYANDYTGLQNAIGRGLNVNAHNAQGDTPMCTAVRTRRYQWYSMLKANGAKTNDACMQTVDARTKQAFEKQNYAGQGVYVRGSSAQFARLSDSSINWWLVGGSIIGGLLLIGGATALALSGEGGGGSSGSGHSSPDVPDAPKGTPVSYPVNPTTSDQTNPAYYQTAEFGGSNFTHAQNFLGQINAQYAYAYAKKVDKPVAGQGIIIGELDTGVDYSHSELSNQIATDSHGKKLGLNFQQGPCRNGDTTNCWVVDTTARLAQFYDSTGNVTFSRTMTSETVEFWKEYEKRFPSDYDWDEVKNTPVIYGDEDTHGTHVAGIMAAQKNGNGMHGVAYNAKLIGASVVFGWYEPEDPILPSFKYLADNGASVINNSWGANVTMSGVFSEDRSFYNYYFGDSLKPALSYLSHASTPVVSVFASGNEADNTYGMELNANLVAAAPLADPSLLYYRDSNGALKAFTSYPDDENKIVSSLFITVVSLNENNTLAYYSQKCGPAAKWCIAAPGGDSLIGNGIASTVGSTVSASGYKVYQGTSMATPVVTGSLAVIMAAFPSLTPQEAVALLFETATPLGDEDLYGHGLVNLKAAMAPVGTLSIPMADTLSGVPIHNSTIVLPRSFHLANNTLPTKMMVLDKYHRGFDLPVNTLIRSTTHSKQAFADDLRLFTYAKKMQNVRLSENLTFAFSDTKKAFDDNALARKSFALTWSWNDNWQTRLSFTGDNTLQGRDYIDKALVNPFTSSMKQSYGLSNTMRLSDSWRFSVSGLIGKNNFFDGNERVDPKNEKTVQSVQTGFTYQPLQGVRVNISSGLLNENSAVLGMSGRGAFKTKDSDTYFAGIEINTEPVQSLHVDFGYYRGYTKGKQHNAFVTMSDIWSESIGFKASYDVNQMWQMGFDLSSPLRVTKGKMALNLPISRDDTYNIVYRNKTDVELSNSKREWDWGVYALRQTGNATWHMKGVVRIHPEHQADFKPDYRLMCAFSLNY